MRRVLLSAGAVFAIAPAVALADARVVDFSRPGPLRTYFDLAMSVARSYLPLALLVAVAFEALGRAPGQARDFAAVVWRFVIILFLLANYERVFGFVLTTMQDVADRVTPADALREQAEYLDHAFPQVDETSDGNGGSPPAPPRADGKVAASAAAAPGTSVSSWVGDAVFGGLMALILFLGQALVYGLDRLAQILAAVFFILGPVALVAGIPRPSGTASRWFHHFVTVASWPIFSGVLLGVMAAIGKQSAGASARTYLGNLVVAVVMGLCALAAPFLSAWIVGGAAQNAAAVGHDSLQSLTRQVAQFRRLIPTGRAGRSERGPPGEAGAAGAAGAGSERQVRPGAARPSRSNGATQRSSARGSPAANPPV